MGQHSSARRTWWAIAMVIALLAASGCRSPWGFGRNHVGQLGDGTSFGHLEPFDLDPGWVSVSAGEQHGIGVRTDGSLWGWGYNGGGQLGQGDFVNRLSP